MLEAARRWKQSATAGELLSRMSSQGAATGLDTPVRERQFSDRNAVLQRAAVLRKRGTLPIAIERRIGPTLDFVEDAPDEAARKAGRPVARIVTSCDPNVEAIGLATSFVVGSRLLLTNWHVFPDAASARGSGANFFHEHGGGGVVVGETFEIDPDYFFLSQERLDFALVGIKTKSVTGTALESVNPVAVTASPAKILIGQPVNIIQHPDGGPKTWVTLNDNRLVGITEEGFIQYTADTLEGSSGSPVFNQAWELVGLHHAGVPDMHGDTIVSVDGGVWDEDMGDDKIRWIANEGARTSAIVRALSETKMGDARQQTVLDGFVAGTTDPIVEVQKLLNHPAVAATSDQPTVVPSIAVGDRTMIFTGPVTINLGSSAQADWQGMVGVERSIRFDTDYSDRHGYKPDFLGEEPLVPLPSIAAARQAEMLASDGKPQILDYHHFSLAMNASRRLQMWSAVNVEYSPDKRSIAGRGTFGSDHWIYDPRIPREAQIGEEFYGPAHQSDRGHIVRRQDNAWGENNEEVEYANSDTFHWTNCTPQHAAFNRAAAPSKYHVSQGLWGGFEMFIQKDLQREDTRACIFAGPVLASDDPTVDVGHGPIQVPRKFWKVVVVKAADAADGGIQAYGFMLSQDDLLEEFGLEFAPGRFARYRTSLQSITAATGVEFDRALIAAESPVQPVPS
jgi:endonuclease G